jgi:VWFA-related protein
VPQFTADKQALLARTSAVVWGRGWLGAPRSPLDPTERLLADPIPGQPFTFWGGRPPQGTFARDVLRRDGRGRLEYEQRTAAFTRGSLGTVNGVINRLLDRRGRTALVFFSDGVPLVRPEVEQANVWDALRRLVDQANRASVVLYTVDARGVVSGGVTAEDTLRSGETPQALAQVGVGRRYEVLESQEPLRYLAAETGGLFLSSNDLADAIGRVALDQSAYYLLGYTPSLATFQPGGDGPRYRKVQIKVKRPGLQVRSRKGFFGISDPLPNSLPAPERDPVRAASR